MNGVANVSLCLIFCSVILSYEGETKLFIKFTTTPWLLLRGNLKREGRLILYDDLTTCH